ncbi:hypothetical protein CPC16_005144 [Podila verticillata]|nr:hypothetical protein CPC16_005144 [Podila verticillata]
MPYWDETEEFSLKNGIPSIFLDKTYTFFNDKSRTISNPLFSYKFQAKITDRLEPGPNYTKPVDYETVRYPFSGLVGTTHDAEVTELHNNELRKKGEDVTNQMLNDNVIDWLNFSSFIKSDEKMNKGGVNEKYKNCLEAPNYTVFSNTTSAQRWNDDHLSETCFQSIVSLESPHNSIHLAVGGFDLPKYDNKEKTVKNSSEVAGANGDMGENDTASFDPIFFFHHCFIDLMFWRWQVKHNRCDSLDIIQGYPGTNSVDSQGPTPGVAGGTWLTLDSPLDPFKNPDDPTRAMTSNDVVNINDLGYKYDYIIPIEDVPSKPAPILIVSNINRATLRGSFVVSVLAKWKNDMILVGTEAVLSRWHVAGCQNCQNHLEVRAHIPMEGWSKEEAMKMDMEKDFQVVLHTRRLNGSNFDNGGGPQQGTESAVIERWTDHL